MTGPAYNQWLDEHPGVVRQQRRAQVWDQAWDRLVDLCWWYLVIGVLAVAFVIATGGAQTYIG